MAQARRKVQDDFTAAPAALTLVSSKNEVFELKATLDAVSRSQAVIEFSMDGIILKANDNFLKTVGYRLDEIVGRHHSMFVDAKEREGIEYREFWSKLNRGEFQSAEFHRIGKGGKDIYIQGSYNPIADENGKLVRVVKFATDVTESATARTNLGEAKLALEEKVASILETVQYATKGDLTHTVTVSGTDPVGQMGEGLNSFLQGLRVSISAIAVSADLMGNSSNELSTISGQMATHAEDTAAQANVVSTASDEVSKNVMVVAAGSEEMQASIREISKSANESAMVAKNAVRVAESTNLTISKLGESSIEIGKVVKVITSIAQQTNLLALNATIEAARAGDAGRGLAVVANEVKELAKETAKATEDIGQKIEAIQSDTKGAVRAIEEIGKIINQINDISNTIASAVEEQTATTNEIGRSVTEASRGVSAIATSIGGVAKAAKGTTTNAGETQAAAKSLHTLAGDLRELVLKFKV